MGQRKTKRERECVRYSKRRQKFRETTRHRQYFCAV